MYVVIMAGGGGTRLWPLSRPDRPKPFLPLLGDETLIQATVRRLLGPELDLRLDDITVITDRRYAPLVNQQLAGVEVLAEPAGRNTAAAVALAALAIDRPADEVMVVLPADHRIDPSRLDAFRRTIADAAQALAAGSPFGVDGPLVTLGVQPSGPATEYGYLVPQPDAGAEIGSLHAYPLRAFEEKPIVARARELLQTPGVAWNAGMFLWRRATILAALERYTTLPGVIGPAAAGSAAALAAAYDRIAPISIDHAVMEGAARDRRVVMAALEVGWSDLGGWGALLEALGRPGVDGRVVQAGQTVDLGDGDLVVLREGEQLAVRRLPPGTMTPDRPVALLRGAADAEPVVQLLLDRCAASEARP